MDKNNGNISIKIIYAQLNMAKFLIDILLSRDKITYEFLYEKLSSIHMVLKKIDGNSKRMDFDCEYRIPEYLHYLPNLLHYQDKQELFYSADEATDVKRRCIGHLRGDFGKAGNDFYTSWTDHQPHLKTDTFKKELDAVINLLRENMFMCRDVMHMFCSLNEESKKGDWYYFLYLTQSYEYYIRCFPKFGDYNFYIYCYCRNEEKNTNYETLADAASQNCKPCDLMELLHTFIPTIVDGELNRIELCYQGLETIVAERKADMISLYHAAGGEIHECPYIYISIDPETKKARTISYHVADVQWYKNVNDYINEGQIKVQKLLDQMTCDWIHGIMRRSKKTEEDNDEIML